MTATQSPSAGSSVTAPTEPLSAVFSCNLCSLTFQTTEQQRAHMKEPWHVYNMKRRVAALPPISLDIFERLVDALAHEEVPDEEVDQSSDESSSSSSSDEFTSEQPSLEAFPTTKCIFCDTESPTTEQSTLHMTQSHGFHIPNASQLTDLETFLGYIAAVVLQYNDCLYCGQHKHSVQGIRQHMLAKGHCRLNLDDDAELLDFWEPSSEESSSLEAAEAVHCATEMQLASGTTISSRLNSADKSPIPNRHAARQRSSLRRARALAATAGIEQALAVRSSHDQTHIDTQDPEAQRAPPSQQSLRLGARRSEMGLTGLSTQQRRALVAVEKKMLKCEMSARAHQRWTVERVANRQKWFKPDVPGRSNG
ncbi:hypothetical protein AAFC00_002637 [Neodothiora populina]|uniref:C2H2-type domain-containing protein n=1 Tax=Neodothiora populina TaxID=2781224 RepID=A0ABR3P856_9PEZI